MRCTNCGHQGAPGSTFCLNCGTRLAQSGPVPAPGAGETQRGPVGLPDGRTPQAATPTPFPGIGSAPTTPVMQGQICTQCSAANAPTMRFCRQCGSPLGGGHQAPAPQYPGPSIPTPVPSRVAPAHGATPVPVHVEPARSRPATPTPPPGAVPPGISQAQRAPDPGAVQQCAMCGGQTPSGFSFCQRCGKPLGQQASGPTLTDASAPHQAPVSTPFPVEAPPAGASPESRRPTPRSVRIPVATEPAWSFLISVNRDGSDGKVHPLIGDYVELGNSASVGLRFDDPYLAGCHARIERLGAGGARIVAVDRLNGVFRRLRQDTRLDDGAMVLIGRELLRFNLLSSAESKPAQLTQHGVSLFGSPMRESWGRISQVLPSGGVRDVRHLYGDEMVVGREEGDLVFGDDEFLSRRHAALRWQDGHCVLSDLGSSNGTFVRIIEPANLSDGDFLRIGDQMFRFKPQ